MNRANFLAGAVALALQPPQSIVAQTIRPVMQRYDIPGMAVGIVTNARSALYDFGVASRATGQPITSATLFEIGSITKTFTATLASYAQLAGKLSLSDMVSTEFPALRGSSFDRVSLLNLATHTAGGLPLQVPDDVTNDDQLLAYLRAWKPLYAPGTYRVYSNVSIGLLGMIVAKRMNTDFVTLMQTVLFPQLGLRRTYLDLPKTQLANYAQGYTSKGTPIRLTTGVLWAQTYGIRTTAADLLEVLKANMGMLDRSAMLERAITATHTGYYRTRGMTQDLIWEQYRYPVTIEQLQAGNSAQMLFEANPVTRVQPPSPPSAGVLLNKTGSTNGFGAYVAFVPAKKIGIVILANKSYPIGARVAAAYDILKNLTSASPRALRSAP